MWSSVAEPVISSSSGVPVHALAGSVLQSSASARATPLTSSTSKAAEANNRTVFLIASYPMVRGQSDEPYPAYVTSGSYTLASEHTSTTQTILMASWIFLTLLSRIRLSTARYYVEISVGFDGEGP